MTRPIVFTLNGTETRVSGVDPHTTLLNYLRQNGLTGAKEGCAEGECGACAVVFVEGSNERARYEAVNGCLVLLPMVDGRKVWTAEGIGKSHALHPVQEAMVRTGGSQCGYCTPGFVSALFAHYYRQPRGDVQTALSGNLCRCTGYRPIREAAESLPAPREDDAFSAALKAPAMATDSLRYEACGVRVDRPRTLEEALDVRSDHPEARVVSGGTDLSVDVNRARRRHAHWLALDGIDALRDITREGESFVIGAGASWNEVYGALASDVPLLAKLIPLFASFPLRTRATIGGNLVNGSPVGDGAPVLLALDAELELVSLRGTRRVMLSDFFTGYRRTALADDELLVRVRIARKRPSHARFYKVSKRPMDDISSVAAAFALDVEGGVIARARLAFGGVAATPIRARQAELVLEGRPFDAYALSAARNVLEHSFAPIDDARASAAYRRAIVTSLWDKFSREVLS